MSWLDELNRRRDDAKAGAEPASTATEEKDADAETTASETTASETTGSETTGSEATGSAEAEDTEAEDQLKAESSVVLRAKGLDDGPNERQLRYSSAEGSDVQDSGTLTRAQRRRRARGEDGTAANTVSDKPEGAPQGDGLNRAQRRSGRRRKG